MDLRSPSFPDFRLPFGSTRFVAGINLKANGKVDKEESAVPRGGLSSITDPRVEAFISGSSLDSLGKEWRGPLIPSSFGDSKAVANCDGWSPDEEKSSQFLIIDKKAHTVTIKSQDVRSKGFFNHFIQASYDNTNTINPKTIVEWVSK